MSRWLNDYKKHEAHNAVSELGKLIEFDAADNVDEAAEEIRRLVKATSYIKSSLKQVDPELIVFADLNSVESTIKNQVIAEINNFKSNNNISHLHNANTQLDGVVKSCRTLVDKSEASSDLIGEYSSDLIGEYESKISSFVETIKGQQTEFASTIEEKNKELAGLASKIGALEKQINGNTQEVESLIENKKEEFSENEKARDQQYSDQLSALISTGEAKVEGAFSGLEKTIQTRQENSLTIIKKLIEEAQDTHSQIRQLHKLSANDSMSGGHKTAGQREALWANLWQLSAFLLFLLAAYWSYGVYTGSSNLLINKVGHDTEISWFMVFKSLSVTALLLTAAGYSARQSTHHRNSERKMKWYALEMQALQPFLSDLEAEDKVKIKSQLTHKMFGNNVQPPSDESQISINSLERIIHTVRQVIGK